MPKTFGPKTFGMIGMIGIAGLMLVVSAAGSPQSDPGRIAPLDPPLLSPLLSPPSEDDYRIGQDDLLEVTVFEVPNLGTTARVSGAGYISMPLIGPVQAAGMTSDALAAKVADALRDNYVNDPQVTVFIREYSSQPVSIVGPVAEPGIYQIQGRKNLLDMLAMAGGLREDAGATIMVFRGARPSPAPDGLNGPVPQPMIEIDIQELTEFGNTGLNVPIFAGDTINVLQAGLVTVTGEVINPGRFVLRNGRNVTVTEALAMGGGPGADAKRSESFIVRIHRDGTREQIPVDIDKIYDGELDDVSMLPNDILFVESSRAKPALRRALDAAISVTSGILIYGVGR